jgi:hypothetical protein
MNTNDADDDEDEEDVDAEDAKDNVSEDIMLLLYPLIESWVGCCWTRDLEDAGKTAAVNFAEALEIHEKRWEPMSLSEPTHDTDELGLSPSWLVVMRLLGV